MCYNTKKMSLNYHSPAKKEKIHFTNLLTDSEAKPFMSMMKSRRRIDLILLLRTITKKT